MRGILTGCTIVLLVIAGISRRERAPVNPAAKGSASPATAAPQAQARTDRPAQIESEHSVLPGQALSVSSDSLDSKASEEAEFGVLRRLAEAEAEAIQRGDTDAVESVIFLGGPAQLALEKVFASLSEATRKKHGTPTKLLATIFCGTGVLEEFEALSSEREAPDLVKVRIGFRLAGDKYRTEEFTYFRTATGWKRVIPVQQIQVIAAVLSGKSL